MKIYVLNYVLSFVVAVTSAHNTITLAIKHFTCQCIWRPTK